MLLEEEKKKALDGEEEQRTKTKNGETRRWEIKKVKREEQKEKTSNNERKGIP